MYPMYHWSIELKIKTKRTTKIKCYELHYDNEQWVHTDEAVSSVIVTGPSFWIPTCMYDPNWPSETSQYMTENI